ncbi:MAG: DNA-binding XRE family transcriptional regulator [Phenylobacterium sp.]|jgi:DNA-binding XRE family transcriptional regulator
MMIDERWFKQKGQFFQQMRKRKFPQDTQRAFAARIGVGLTTIQNLEAGKDGVAWGTIIKVLDILGLEHEVEKLLSLPAYEIKVKAGENW